MTKGCNASFATIAESSQTIGVNRFYTTTLISGIVGSLARNYIRVNELHANPVFTIQFIEFHANMICLGSEVMSMIRSPKYTIYSET